MSKVINVVLYQLGWFSCIIGAAQGFPIHGAFAALALIVVHLMLAEERKAEILLMVSACLLGILVDSAQQAMGVFTFKSDPSWPHWLPLWVFVIWAQFATLFRYALYRLAGRYLLAAVLGMFGGPLAYWGGGRLGAAQFSDSLLFSLLTLGLVWALVTPLLVWLAARVDPREGRYRSLGIYEGKR